MNETHFRKLERMYRRAPINEDEGTTLTVTEGAATLDVPISPESYHPLGAVHGAVYFKALDDAAFFAANSLVEGVFVLTTNFNLHLERPVSEGTIHAEGRVVNDNPNQLIAEAVARDDAGNELARGSGTFQKSSAELTADIGYE
ncbi:PaaI family thioesterase [Halococcus sediminicola]|uniref:PaaI family thioesterase n=1 Tax=Halococcus sediminicola TaxID=1264579 RepID=UPI001F17EC83|nr:PaaI family thioesterase [Halococcus sediminicola]